MARIVRYLVVAVAFLAAGANSQLPEIRLRAGTLIHCTLYEPNFSSHTAQIGEPVICYLRPLREFGYSVFPRGSYLTGRFVDYKDPGRIVGKGWLKLEFDRMILSPTTEVPVATKVISIRRYRMDAEGKILGRRPPQARHLRLEHSHSLPGKTHDASRPRPIPDA